MQLVLDTSYQTSAISEPKAINAYEAGSGLSDFILFIHQQSI